MKNEINFERIIVWKLIRMLFVPHMVEILQTIQTKKLNYCILNHQLAL